MKIVYGCGRWSKRTFNSPINTSVIKTLLERVLFWYGRREHTTNASNIKNIYRLFAHSFVFCWILAVSWRSSRVVGLTESERIALRGSRPCQWLKLNKYLWAVFFFLALLAVLELQLLFLSTLPILLPPQPRNTRNIPHAAQLLLFFLCAHNFMLISFM